MAKKKPINDRFLLERKFEVVQKYIDHREHKLEQFRIDIQKAVLGRTRGELGGFMDRIHGIVEEFYSADPSVSLLEDNLKQARAVLNVVYGEQQKKFTSSKEKQTESSQSTEDAPFDSLLSKTTNSLLWKMSGLLSSDTAGEDPGMLPSKIAKLLNGLAEVFDATLEPARLVRQSLIGELGDRPISSTPKSASGRRRGRPRDPEIKKRNQRICEDWKAGKYASFAQLGKAYKVSETSARKIVSGIRQIPKQG